MCHNANCLCSAAVIIKHSYLRVPILNQYTVLLSLKKNSFRDIMYFIISIHVNNYDLLYPLYLGIV